MRDKRRTISEPWKARWLKLLTTAFPDVSTSCYKYKVGFLQGGTEYTDMEDLVNALSDAQKTCLIDKISFNGRFLAHRHDRIFIIVSTCPYGSTNNAGYSYNYNPMKEQAINMLEEGSEVLGVFEATPGRLYLIQDSEAALEWEFHELQLTGSLKVKIRRDELDPSDSRTRRTRITYLVQHAQGYTPDSYYDVNQSGTLEITLSGKQIIKYIT